MLVEEAHAADCARISVHDQPQLAVKGQVPFEHAY